MPYLKVNVGPNKKKGAKLQEACGKIAYKLFTLGGIKVEELKCKESQEERREGSD